MTIQGLYSGAGNTKLGSGVGVVNRMPVNTCPGASEACMEFCYALKGFFPFHYDKYKQEIKLPEKLRSI